MDDFTFLLIIVLTFFSIGSISTFAILKSRNWFLPKDSVLVLSVNDAGIGKIWRADSEKNLQTIPGFEEGLMKLDEKAVWLPKERCKLFLHYSNFFSVIPPKKAAFFSFFKERKEEVERERDPEGFSRQKENQPEGIVFDLRDIKHWLETVVSPGHIIEMLAPLAVSYSKLAEEFFGKRFNWKIIILFVIIFFVIIFFIFPFFAPR